MWQISNVYFVMIRGQLFIKKVGLQIKYLQAICKALNAQGNNELTAKKLQMADKIKK